MIPLRDDNPTRITPFVTYAIIIACVLVFVWQALHTPPDQQRIAYSLGLVPAVLFRQVELPAELQVLPAELTVFTSMFLHGGLMHLLGNMLYLWIFGNNVEEAMGHVRFFIFYLLCGTAAAFAQAWPNPDSTLPMIGASGALSGVLGAYLLLHPRARVLVLIPLGFFVQMVYVPAALMLGLWFLLQIASSLMVNVEEGGVAWFAHIGGFVAGLVLVVIFRRRGVRLLNTRR